MSEPIRILYVDDNPLDRELVRDVLEKEHGGFHIIEAKSRVDFETRLAEGGYDLVLSDFNILGYVGLQVIDAVHTKKPGMPVVLVTGTGSEEIAVEAMKRGAFDYVIKKPTHIRHLPYTIHAALEKKRLKEERKQAEEALRKSEEKYRKLVENLKERYFFYSHGSDGVFTYLSPSISNILGYTQEEFTLHYTKYLTDNPINKEVVSHTELSIKGISQPPYLVEIFHKNRSIRWLEVTEFPVFDREGRVVAVEGIACNITEKKMADERIKQEKELTANLLRIAGAVANTTDVERLMESIVNCISRIMGFDVCLSYLWDNEAKVFMPSHAHGLAHGMIPIFRTEPFDKNAGLIEEAIERKEPLIEKAVAVRELPLQWIPDINTVVAIPLIGKKTPLGLIVGIYKNPRTLTENDMKVIQGIMHQVSTALKEAGLYRDSIDKAIELSHKVDTIQVMHEIDRSILSTLNSSQILETATRLIAKIVHCDKATVALVDRERQGFVFAAGFGVSFLPVGAFVPLADSNTAEVMETERVQYIPNLTDIEYPRYFEAGLIKEGIISQIRVPLTVKGEVIGVLSIGSKRSSAFTSGDLSTLEKIAAQIGVALSNARLISDLEELFVGIVKSLSSAIDAKSPWTAGHSERVTSYALQIGKAMGLPEKELKDLELAGLFHDVGKIGTYEHILDKPDSLTVDEIKTMRQHTVRGAEILSPIKQLMPIIAVIKHHHEFYDGTGYPDALKGEEIPLHARILTVADTVDAMGADRPYRKGRPMEVIIAEIKRCAGTQFDPKVVDMFLKVIGET